MAYKFEMDKSMKVGLIAVLLSAIYNMLMTMSLDFGSAALKGYILIFVMVIVAYNLTLNFWK